jgi:predicted DNA-binding ribbon-helix-helix protein
MIKLHDLFILRVAADMYMISSSNTDDKNFPSLLRIHITQLAERKIKTYNTKV